MSLDEVRAAIDVIDKQIIPLLAERQLWVERAGHIKKDQPEEAVRAPERVEEVIQSVRELAIEHGMSATIAENTYRVLVQSYIDHQLTLHRSLQQR